MRGLIHCHSENSRYDSAMDVGTLCRRAKDLGYEAVALTDHGTLTGIDDFVKAAKETGIKPIPGVEAYMQEDGSGLKRLHLILMAKDDLGYTAIGKAVTESNRRIDEKGFPRMNKEILTKYFGPDSKYHGHVIATSACAGGILAGILLSPLEFNREIRKLKKRQSRYESMSSASYAGLTKAYEENEKKAMDLVRRRDELSALSKKTYRKRENALEKLEGEAYAEAKAALDAEKAESERAKIELDDVRARISLTKKASTQIRARIKDIEASSMKYAEIQKEIDRVNGERIPVSELYADACREAVWYDKTFGHGNFYIEIQYHGYLMDTYEETDGAEEDEKVPGAEAEEVEKMAMPYLAKIAKEYGIPLVAANDAHIPDGSAESIRARQIICSLRYAQRGFVSAVKQGDDQIYLKSEEELREALLNVVSPEEADEAIANAYRICDECSCEFKTGSHYPKFQGLKDGETADDALRRMAQAGIEKRFPGREGWTKVYQDRLEYELGVISDMGYSDYFLIVQDFLAFGRKLGHLSNKSLDYLRENIKTLSLTELVDYVDGHQERPGFAIGAGRGSAAGSLVAYLVGITNIIDPLKYDLLFERFLNKDRVSMPDVDSDLSPDVRDLVIEYCKKVYGIQSVANIVTKGYMAPKGAVRNVARVIGIEKDRKEYYQMLSDRIAKMVPFRPGTTFETCEDELRAAFAPAEGDSDETKAYKADANEIIDQAKLVEGVFLNYGMHAAGVIIADGNPIDDYVPLMRDEKSGDMKVQCDMVQAEEEHGLLKFDFLGLRNLKIVTLTLRGIERRTGQVIDVEKIPFEPEVFRNIFAKGYTGSVFQFESSGMKKMLRSAKPDCLEDLIALVALYRPGPMDFIPKYIEAKQNPEKTTYLCPQLEPILGKTYGTIVYQEQVMEIFQKLAGYSLSQADNVRRFMSKKKMDKLEHEREAFINGDEERGIEGCKAHGIPEETAEKLFDQMVEFAKYAFNKSHAAAYAMLSYITAYLKYYYTADYMCAVLNCTDDIKKMPSVLSDCREMGITVLPPSVNDSQLGFTVVGGNIMFGLDSVKGTRAAYASAIIEDRNEHGRYLSFKDFMMRDVADKSTTENLICAGAMDEFNPNRAAMLKAYETGSELVEKIKAKKENIAELNGKPDDQKETKRFQTTYKRAKDSLEMLENQYEILRVINCPEDGTARILKEKEVLGFFITAHPLDSYRDPAEAGCIRISDLDASRGERRIMGIIEGYEVKRRKSDNKPMAFFNLEDKSGVIRVCCFAKSYEENEEMLGEDKVVILTGTVNQEIDEMSGEAELQFFMNRAAKTVPDQPPVYVFIRSMPDWNGCRERILEKGYKDPQGHPVIVYDELMGEYRRTGMRVKERILDDADFVTKI